MRLINTTTQTLEEFESTTTPPYAILSHTWTDHEEIRYQDISTERASGKGAGYAKLDNGCRVALAKGYDYIWIDTCCIDKTNNAELSEAINSMYFWYQSASICFAYLADVPTGVDMSDEKTAFSASRWFTRGWTLQELLAPPQVIFLADNWTEIGSRTELFSPISRITGIPSTYLLGELLEHASIAMRFSWASERNTTKPEDIAYCLLGIFDIQMPLLYGEREAGAFRRLQQEIMKDSDDHTIFAWQSPLPAHGNPQKEQNVRANRTFSLLAPSPASFKGSRDITETEPLVVEGFLEGIRTPTTFSNKGLHLSLPAFSNNDETVTAILNCCNRSVGTSHRCTIQLRDISTNGGRYIRVESHILGKKSIPTALRKAKYMGISVPRGGEGAVNGPQGVGKIQTLRTYSPAALPLGIVSQEGSALPITLLMRTPTHVHPSELSVMHESKTPAKARNSIIESLRKRWK